MTAPDPDAALPKATDAAPERPYQSLYRRYRPQRFDQVRGQDHVTRALRNAVRDGRITHAYLFSGPRGTGKTSTARILAKALDCASPVDGEPCGTCPSCLSIAAGTSFDVHELDAASNNGVDAMRDLVARAALATPGRWKVYIVDEVHMLSTAASNALLKTLEEPPDHVVFVLATTDPQKVLPTIRSRTQHFEFHLLGEDILEALLEDVAADAGLELPDGGLGVALRRGRGSARDALSMLDQVAAAGVADDDSDALAGIVAAIADRDTGAALGALDGALHGGRDPQQVAVELVERLRTGFLALVAPGVALPTAIGTPGAGEARSLGTARCVRSMELVGAAIVAMRDAPEPRITLEVALVRAAHPEADDTVESLLDRVVQLERRLEAIELHGGQAGTAPPGTRHDAGPEVGAGTTPRDSPRPATGRPVLGASRARAAGRSGGLPDLPPAGLATNRPQPSAPAAGTAATPGTPEGPAAEAPPDRDALVAAWGDHVVTALRPKVRAYFQAGHFLGVDGADAVFALPNAAHVSQAEPLKSEVATALSAHFGRPVALRLVAEGTWSPASEDARASTRSGGGVPGAGEVTASPGSAGAATHPAQPAEAAEAEVAATPPTPSTLAPTKSQAATPAPAAPAAAEPYVEEGVDLDELRSSDGVRGGVLADPGSGLTWAEDRLLQAFPGAEEV